MRAGVWLQLLAHGLRLLLLRLGCITSNLISELFGCLFVVESTQGPLRFTPLASRRRNDVH